MFQQTHLNARKVANSKIKLKTEHHQQNKQRTTNTTRPALNKEKTREADQRQ
jgi:hypothetical protein